MIRKILSKTINKIENIIVSEIEKDKIYKENYNYLIDNYVNKALPFYLNFSTTKLEKDVLNFVNSCQLESDKKEYRYSFDVSEGCIYNTVYAFLTYSLFNKNFPISNNELLEYLNSFQRDDGFFYDERLIDSQNWESDWWGKKHLLPHVLMCYRYLNATPKYELKFLSKYYNKEYLELFLTNLNPDGINDDDNVLMNLGVALQFQRDFFHDDKARDALNYIYTFIESHISEDSGRWGNKGNQLNDISRAQQRLYHLYILWLYDNRTIPYIEKVIDISLETQTIFGGFSSEELGSACTDIDCIFLLVKLSQQTEYRKDEIEISLKKAFIWVLSNFNTDGGAVFKRNHEFQYGSHLMFSRENISNLFATWFRTVSLAYLCEYFDIDNNFNFNECPGYMY